MSNEIILIIIVLSIVITGYMIIRLIFDTWDYLFKIQDDMHKINDLINEFRPHLKELEKESGRMHDDMFKMVMPMLDKLPNMEKRINEIASEKKYINRNSSY